MSTQPGHPSVRRSSAYQRNLGVNRHVTWCTSPVPPRICGFTASTAWSGWAECWRHGDRRRRVDPRGSRTTFNELWRIFFRSLDKLSSDFHVPDCTWFYCCVTNKLDWIDVLFRVGLHQLEVLGGDLRGIREKCIQPKVRNSLYFSGKFLSRGEERAGGYFCVLSSYLFWSVCNYLLAYLLTYLLIYLLNCFCTDYFTHKFTYISVTFRGWSWLYLFAQPSPNIFQ